MKKFHHARKPFLIRTLLATFFSGLLFSHAPLADGSKQTNNFALGAGVGTTGLSLNGTFQLSDNINFRGIYANYDFSENDTESGIAYQFDIELDTFSLLLDWHPSADSGFRISLGGINNGTNFSAKTTQTSGNITVGNSTFLASDIGTINAKVDYDSFAPYIGIGWGNAVDEAGRWSFSFDIGAMFTGSPDVSVRCTQVSAGGAAQALCDQQADEEENELEDELGDFDVYPVVSIGFAYKF